MSGKCVSSVCCVWTGKKFDIFTLIEFSKWVCSGYTKSHFWSVLTTVAVSLRTNLQHQPTITTIMEKKKGIQMWSERKRKKYFVIAFSYSFDWIVEYPRTIHKSKPERKEKNFSQSNWAKTHFINDVLIAHTDLLLSFS